MAEKLFQRFGHLYILVMMVLTRLSGTTGGLLVIYYVELTLKMPPVTRTHFRIGSIVVTVFACALTVLLAQWETRTVRRVLWLSGRGQPLPSELVSRAGRDVMYFLARHHWHEAWLVPCSTLVPLSLFLWIVDGASLTLLMNLTIAVFMGVAMALMTTFFIAEYLLQPVIRFLLRQGAQIDYASLPVGRLRFRFRLCFTLIIMTTALMIGTLARQRAADILDERDHNAAIKAVAALQSHAAYITLVAVATGIVFSTLLANSVACRARNLVQSMERVASGNLSERMLPTGNDEIDVLARQFNAMVQTLEHNDHTIRDLNTNLEHKVRERTQQLERTLQDLRATQTQLTDVAHRAGMAEIATGVLHNVGNVLNSVNISTTLLGDRVRGSKIDDLSRLAARLTEHQDNLGEFVAEERGRKLVDYLTKLTTKLAGERQDLLQEMAALTEKVGHIRGIISAQQSYARRVCFREQFDVGRLVSEILEMHRVSMTKHDVRLVTDFAELPPAHLEKAKLVQVLDNLVKNAIESMAASDAPERQLSVRVEPHHLGRIRITVSDTGSGIAPDHLGSIFTYGFTTKPTGNGFGLHSSALAMTAVGGALRVRSEGVGRGATFEVEFPLEQADEAPDAGRTPGDNIEFHAIALEGAPA